MDETITPITNTCNFMAVKPIMVELPYPEIRVREKNQTYANLLSIDYCGATSELSAITQYITISEEGRKMLLADIEAEKAAINQYRMHISMIKDNHVNAVLARIIKDEKYHIMLLETLLKEISDTERKRH